MSDSADERSPCADYGRCPDRHALLSHGPGASCPYCGESLDPETRYGIVMPFVVVTSNGGAYDDSAFVAGARFGQDMAELKAESPAEWSQTVHPEMVAQYDLLAMHLGYTMTTEPWDERPDEWTIITFVKASHSDGYPATD